jgi:hypothetical protein
MQYESILRPGLITKAEINLETRQKYMKENVCIQCLQRWCDFGLTSHFLADDLMKTGIFAR